jgi:ribosome recycling factor
MDMFAEPIKKILADAEERMKKSVQVTSHELASLRTGRASPAIFDGIKVEYYGSPYEIRELATITVPDARTIVIDPWDKQMLEPIRKAIMNSPLSLNPVNDGRVLRINLPPLTEERRRELLKVVNQRAEHGKIAIRNIRKDAQEELRKLDKQPGISEDMLRRAREELDKLTEKYVQEVEKTRKAKEKEVLEE